MNNYSPNMLKTFEDCHKKFEYKYMQKIPMPQKSSPFEKGKKIHALANYYLNGADLTKLETALSEEENEIWQKLKSNSFFNKTYINSEYSLSAKIGNYWVGGRLDALMKDENYYYILDYKTGSIPKNTEYDFQTMIYLICAAKILNTEKIKFVYIDLKNNENKVVEFSNELKRIYETKLLSTLEKIHMENFESNYDKCKFCEYKKLCI